MRTSALSTNDNKPDVLTITLFVAAAVHAIIILGLSFKPFLSELTTPPSVEVILVNNQNNEKPEEADYLAASSQDGGGESDENTRPSSPFTSAQDFDTEGVAQVPILASSPAPSTAAADDVLTTLFADDEIDKEKPDEESIETPVRRDTFVVQQNLDIAKLSAEIDRKQEEYAKRPKIKTVNARTTEATSADYMYRWVEKVERIGNLNYPDAARRNQLTGNLMLVVGIWKSGEIHSIKVKRSSGEKVLDDAAKRIVELSGPFDPMEGSLAEETDILYIIRTWEFQSSNTVISY
ncbi:MAG: TonB family protein [Granulosicoccus sp.]